MTHSLFSCTATSFRMRLTAGLGSIVLVFSAGAVHGQTLLTETTWGGAGADIATGVARAADGSAYLVGTTDSFAVDQFGNPAPRGYIVKLTNGAVAWQRIWNGPTIIGGADWSVAVAADGSVYLAGTTSDNGVDAALVKFDSNGNLLWERTWGGVEADGANAVATHTDGSVYIVGRTTSFPTGSAGLFVVKFDASGTVAWQKVWDGAASGEGAAVAPDGSVYAGGSIIRAPENLAEFDILALKLASSGTLTWARRYAAGEVVDVRGGMAAASDGSVYLAGALQAPGGGGIVGIAALIVKLDPNGNLLFDKRCCTKSGDTGEGVTVGPDGSVHVAGTTTVLGAGNQDSFVIRLQPTGKKVTGAATWGTATGFETGGGVAVTTDGAIMLGATTTEPPPYSLLDATVKLSSARGAASVTANGLADVTGTVANPARGTTEPTGSTTFSGNFESALVHFTLP
jgi:Domain of unknown function (DUF5122) beta-propeller